MQTDTMNRFDRGYLCLILLEGALTFIVRSIKNSTVGRLQAEGREI